MVVFVQFNCEPPYFVICFIAKKNYIKKKISCITKSHAIFTSLLVQFALVFYSVVFASCISIVDTFGSFCSIQLWISIFLGLLHVSHYPSGITVKMDLLRPSQYCIQVYASYTQRTLRELGVKATPKTINENDKLTSPPIYTNYITTTLKQNSNSTTNYLGGLDLWDGFSSFMRTMNWCC